MSCDSKIRIAVVQPSVPDSANPDAYIAEGMRFARSAADVGADIISLPEYFGVFGYSHEQWRTKLTDGDLLLERLRVMAVEQSCSIIYPSVELVEERLFNTTYLIDSSGDLVGKYRKTHLTLDERTRCGLTPGDELPVFELENVPVAVITCYDGYFPEVARVLALKGAKIIFWPSLQRGATEDSILLQARSRALDNSVFIARSSYGHPSDVVWKTGMMPGASCVVDREGRVIANAGVSSRFFIAEIDWRNERPKPRSFGGGDEYPSVVIREDRRPELYAEIAK
ncbi:MAG: carbon-nitrogen hydrolase family protein [Victivallales bacterium]|nr:carbon-nitrogen hydrolase family protein [Victivallales bacterium]